MDERGAQSAATKRHSVSDDAKLRLPFPALDREHRARGSGAAAKFQPQAYSSDQDDSPAAHASASGCRRFDGARGANCSWLGVGVVLQEALDLALGDRTPP